jgi:hypothetical protein
VWVLAFLLTALAWAQPAGAPKAVFPDDTQDPKLAGGAELLEAVCPGHVVVGKEVACKIACPEFTSMKGGDLDWSVARVIRGHFLSPTSDDAVLSMSGCEPHALNFGGTILLTMRSGKWTMLWYKGEIPTRACHRVKLETGREILICFGEYGGQGVVIMDVYIEDFLAPLSALNTGGKDGTFFDVFDNAATCAWNIEDESKPSPITREYLERVEFHNSNDGIFLGLSVFARRGERTMTPTQVKACVQEQIPARPHRGLNFNPPTQPYRVDFKFDGRRMVRVGGSPDAPR